MKVKRILTIDKISDAVTTELINTGVVSIVLFGSYARGDANETSDIDLLLDSNGEFVGLNLFGLRGKLEACLGKKVDLIEISELDTTSDLANPIKREGILIYEQKKQ